MGGEKEWEDRREGDGEAFCNLCRHPVSHAHSCRRAICVVSARSSITVSASCVPIPDHHAANRNSYLMVPCITLFFYKDLDFGCACN